MIEVPYVEVDQGLKALDIASENPRTRLTRPLKLAGRGRALVALLNATSCL